MSFSALSLAVLAPLFGEHEALHPTSVDFFIEIPDVSSVHAAYRQAPLSKMFADERVNSFLGEFDLEVGDLWEGALEQRFPGTDMAAVLGGMGRTSLSLVLGSGELAEFGVQITGDFASEELPLEIVEYLRKRAGIEESGGPLTLFDSEPDMPSMWTMVEGNRLVLGAGVVTPESYQARARGGAAGLAAVEAPFEAASGTVLCDVQGWRPLFDIIEALAKVFGRPLTLPLPRALDPLETPGRGRLQLEGGRFEWDLFSMGTDEDVAFGMHPLDPSWIASVPPDVFGMYSSAVDAGRIAGFLRDFLVKQGTTDVAALEERLGSPLDQPFRHLGPGMVAYMFPVSGLGLPATYAWIEVADAEAFAPDLARFLEALPEMLPGSKASTRDYRPKDGRTGKRVPVPVTTITLPEHLGQIAPMVSFQPTLALLDDRLLVGVTSITVKRELKRVFGSYGEEQLPNPLSATGLTLPSDARSVLWVNWGALIEGAFQLARALGSLMGGADLPIDLGKLPDPKIFTRFLEPTFHVSRQVAGGVHHHHVSSIGPEVFALPGAIKTAIDEQAQAQAEAPPPEPVEEKDVAGDTTRDGLERLRLALQIHSLTQGAFPQTLAELEASSEDFPDGFIEGGVPDDGWGRAFHYALTDEGYELRSFGANGVDEAGGGDDITP